jgi:hypothetical protein
MDHGQIMVHARFGVSCGKIHSVVCDSFFTVFIITVCRTEDWVPPQHSLFYQNRFVIDRAFVRRA